VQAHFTEFFFGEEARRTGGGQKRRKRKRENSGLILHTNRDFLLNLSEKRERERERERGKASKQARIETIQHGQNFSSFFERRTRGLRVVRLLCFVFVF
jgi:hypothetical protein